MGTYVEYITRITPPFLRRRLGQAITGVTGGLMWDLLMAGVNEATKLAVLHDSTPDDAVELVASQKGLERWPGESLADLKARIPTALEDGKQSGTDIRLENAYDEYGANVVIYEDAEWHRPPQPWWAQCWGFLAEGDHPATDPYLYNVSAITYSNNPATAAIYGAGGLTPQYVSALRRIAKKIKPARTVFREFIFEITGKTYGATAPVYGTPGFTYGGTQAVISGEE